MKVTVAICTWNRADLLDQTLEQMRELKVPEKVEWELLVVDNKSTDHTQAVLQKYSDRLPLIPLFESKQGHSHARNCAIEASTGELIIWTDDDVLVEPDWVSQYVRAANEWPEAYAFGGKVLPWYESDPPAWLRDNIQEIGRYFALRDLGGEERTLDVSEVPYGANMAFRRSAFRKKPYFDTSLGRVGARLTSGDDSAVMRSLIRSGKHVVWVPDSRVQHFLPSERMKLSYIRKLHYSIGRYEMGKKHSAKGLRKIPRWLWRQWLELEFTYRTERIRLIESNRWLNHMMKASQFRGLIDAYRLGMAD